MLGMSQNASPPPRVIALEGASNFRDLGGYRGHGGRPLRWRRLFRSDHLGGLTAADCGVLAQFGVAAALDFRGVHESAAAPYRVPGVVQRGLPIEPTVAQRMQEVSDSGRELSGAVVEGLMRDLYRGLVRRHAGRFTQFFAEVLQAEAPLVFHCTAGKDRTGVAAALLLLALGVSRVDVMEDYLLTNTCYKPPWAPRADVSPEVQQALWGVLPGYLEAALTVVDEEHGGPVRYLAQQVGLGPAQLEALSARYLSAG